MTRADRAAGGALILALAGLAACAQIEPPSGGPEDRTPPQLVVSRPDTNAVAPGWSGPVVLVFDERVSERGVDQAVEVSPRTSSVVVRHSGDELHVRLREGWRPGIIYHVTVLPVLRDLFGNPVTEPIRLVFSTGPEIPETRAVGQVIDRTTGRAAAEIRVEAVRIADSLVYATATDTAGRFVITDVPTGEYVVRAFDDLNRNRRLDEFEASDSAAVEIVADDSAVARLSVVPPDSTAPRLTSAEIEGRTLEIEFDDLLDPAQDVPTASVTLTDPAGGSVPIARIGVGRLSEPEDTAAVEVAPARTLIVELAEDAELQPGAEYTVSVRNVRNLVGLASDVETTVTARVPPEEGEDPVPAPPDSTPNPNSIRP